MSHKTLDRRKLMKMALAGMGSMVAMEQLGGVPLLGTWIDSGLAAAWRPWVNRYDAFAMMQEALRGGPAFLGVHQAMAQAAAGADSPWTLVQIKVCNHVCTPMVFRLGQLAGGTVTTDASVKLASDSMTAAKTYMQGLGVDTLSDNPRWAALRFNKFFANILQNGTADGAAAGSSNLIGLSTNDVGPLDTSKVAVQAFLHLKQITTNNHALKGCKLRESLPDVTLFAQEQGLITSPLGISCFMMGGNYDRAEGAVPLNAVLDASATETVKVNSRKVTDYVNQIGQFVGKSYADRSSIEENVVYRFDQLVQKDPSLRRDLLASIAQFKAGLSNLKDCASLEAATQTLDKTKAVVQANDAATGKLQGASTEFVAQCKYVAQSMNLPGLPVRNYSLFLNVTDMDGQNLDVATDGGGGNAKVMAYSNVEGMKQLAMGLNILGKAIAGGAKVLVVVSSEGGRASDMTDSKTGFSIVMGPGGSGMLADGLFANNGMINVASSPAATPVVQDPGNQASAVAWDMDGLCNADGSKVQDVVATGDVQMGVVEFLEEQTGVKARASLTGTDGRYVKLKRA